MSDLIKIYEKDVHPGLKEDQDIFWDMSRSARVVVVDRDGHVALLHVRHRCYYMLPGGRADSDEESYEQIARREIREEAGVDIEMITALGMSQEFRNKRSVQKISQCFVGRVIGEKGPTKFTEKEVHRGFELLWVPAAHALDLFVSSKPEDYTGPFTVKRDSHFLQKAVDLGLLD